jgi:predicted ATPase
VELVQAMQERGDLKRDAAGCWLAAERIDWQMLPARVEGLFETRIHALDEALQTVLTIASVEGQCFTAEVIARVQQLDDRRLVQQLSRELDKKYRLVTAQTPEWLGNQRLSRYRFRHHLCRHYLYHHLDELERASLHQAVGSALEALYGDRVERVAARLAWHFQQAGLTDKAASYRLLAGKQAVGPVAATRKRSPTSPRT